MIYQDFGKMIRSKNVKNIQKNKLRHFKAIVFSTCKEKVWNF